MDTTKVAACREAEKAKYVRNANVDRVADALDKRRTLVVEARRQAQNVGTTRHTVGTSANTRSAMDELRQRLNKVKTTQRQSGSDGLKMTTVIESAQLRDTQTQAFVPKSEILLTVTPSTKVAFQQKAHSTCGKCEHPFELNPRCRYGKDPVKAMATIKLAIKDDALEGDVDTFESHVKKLNERIKAADAESSVFFRLAVEPCTSGHGKEIVIDILSHDDEADPLQEFLADAGNDFFGDANPLTSKLHLLVKGGVVKLQFGESIGELLNSDKSLISLLNNMRISFVGELSNEVVKEKAPNIIAEYFDNPNSAVQMFQRFLPLIALQNITARFTISNPEYTLGHAYRKFAQCYRRSCVPSSSDDELPLPILYFTTLLEEDFAQVFSYRLPLGLTGTTLRDFFKFVMFQLSLNPDDDGGITPTVAAIFLQGAKIVGPVKSVQLSSRSASGSFQFKDVDISEAVPKAFSDLALEFRDRLLASVTDAKKWDPKEDTEEYEEMLEDQQDEFVRENIQTLQKLEVPMALVKSVVDQDPEDHRLLLFASDSFRERAEDWPVPLRRLHGAQLIQQVALRNSVYRVGLLAEESEDPVVQSFLKMVTKKAMATVIPIMDKPLQSALFFHNGKPVQVGYIDPASLSMASSICDVILLTRHEALEELLSTKNSDMEAGEGEREQGEEEEERPNDFARMFGTERRAKYFVLSEKDTEKGEEGESKPTGTLPFTLSSPTVAGDLRHLRKENGESSPEEVLDHVLGAVDRTLSCSNGNDRPYFW